MKNWIFPLGASLAVLCGCAHTYVMKLSNGVQITTPHKPKLKGSDYYYKDALGRENKIAQSRVVEIAPASMVAEEGFFWLDAPVKRVSAPDTPAPFAPVMEAEYVPSEERIARAVRSLL